MKRLTILCLFLVACTQTPEPHRCVNIWDQWEIQKAAGNTGLYFPIGEKEGLFFIKNSDVGLHELCHFVDQERDFPSETQMFQDAINEYLASDPEDAKLLEEISQGTAEIYAELCRYSLVGELPDVFKPFFIDEWD